LMRPTEAARCITSPSARRACLMRSNRPELIKQMTDVLDEMIPAIPVDDRTSALIARIGECMLKAAAEEQASYETLLAAASAEMGAISKERTSPSFT
jgi:hypothetical protein